jgi:diguanylate cyclase (GGDEF)-like protein
MTEARIILRKLSPLFVFLVGIIVSFWLRSIIITAETKLITNEIQSTANLVASELDLGMRSRIEALERMGERWIKANGTLRDDWESDSKNYIEDQPGFQAIEWISADFIVTWVVPIEGNESAIGLDLAFEERRLEALQVARDGKKITVTRTIDLVQGGKGFLVYMPLHIGINEKFDGFILGVYQVEDIFREILSSTDGFVLEIYDGEEKIYSLGSHSDVRVLLAATANEVLYGVEWNIQVVPSEAWIKNQHTSTPNAFFAFGIIISFLLASSIFYINQSARLRDELKRALDSVEQLARTDSLTGLFNRRGIWDILEREFARNKRFDNPYAIALFDLDGLKLINDKAGHNAGDEAIVSIAKMLKKAKREYDWIGRYGGDEFLGIFPGASKEQISLIQDRFEKEWENYRKRGKQIPNFSMGWAISTRERNETAKQMIDRADKELYNAKHAKLTN